MNRAFATITLAVCVFGSACKDGNRVESTKLIPDGATVVGGVDLRPIFTSKAWEANKQKLETQAGKELEDVEACNVGPKTWKSVVFGLDPLDPEAKFAAVVSIDGIGKKDTLDCLAKKYKDKNAGKDVWTTGEQDGRTTIAIPDGEITGYVVDPNTIAFVGKAWTEATRQLLGGQGKAAVDGSLKDVLARAKQDHVWVAGLWPEGAPAPAPFLAGVKFASFALNVTDGLGAVAQVAYASADEAKTKAAEVTQQFEGLKAFAPSVGLPQAVVDSVKIEAQGDAVTASFSISAADIDALAAKAGLGGAPAPEPTPVPEPTPTPEAEPAAPPAAP